MIEIGVHETPPLLDVARQAAQLWGVYSGLKQARSAAQLAVELGVSARRLQRLLDVLVAVGDLERDTSGSYRVRAINEAIISESETAEARLVASILRRDTHITEQELARGDLDVQRLTAHALLSEKTGAPARELAEQLTPLLREGGVFLDAGGGYGAYTAALLEQLPGLRAVIADLPHVVAAGRAYVRGMPGRIEWLQGELTQLELGHGYRVALISNVLHLNSAHAARRIVARVAQSLAPGGMLVIKDLALNAQRTETLTALLYALSMSLFTDDADVHDSDALVQMAHDAGLADVHRATLRSAPEAVLILGRKAPSVL